MEHAGTLYVTLFGQFAIRCGEGDQARVLTEQDSSSRRMWTFLEYLSAFHQREVTQEELIEVLWGGGDSSTPANALKTLLHRGRAAMEHLGFPDGKQVILYRRGVYTWGENVTLQLDTEEFDRLCAGAQEGDVDSALAAISLYGGDFLPNSTGSPWAVSLRTYYHGKFLKLCRDTTQRLLEDKRYEQGVAVARQATQVDPYDEGSHLLLMRSMAAAGARQAAMQHYTYVVSLLMDQLGVSPSQEMTQFYRELAKANMGVELDLGVVQEQLLEDQEKKGAFFCEYGIFQDVYRLMARSAMRSGQVVQLAMLTVLDRAGRQMTAARGSAAMESLRSSIQSSLRSGDAFTRFSAAQYLILLPTASYENGVRVLQRILDHYERGILGKTTQVKYSLLPVLPVPEDGEEPLRGPACRKNPPSGR